MYSLGPSYKTKLNDISDPYETKFTARTLNDTVQARERRGFGSILVQAIPGLITLAKESVSSYIKGRQQWKINTAVEALRNDDTKIRNDLRQHRNELLMFGRYNLNYLRGVINTINALPDIHTYYEKEILGKVDAMVKRNYPDYVLAATHISHYRDMKMVTFTVDQQTHSLIVTFQPS